MVSHTWEEFLWYTKFDERFCGSEFMYRTIQFNTKICIPVYPYVLLLFDKQQMLRCFSIKQKILVVIWNFTLFQTTSNKLIFSMPIIQFWIFFTWLYVSNYCIFRKSIPCTERYDLKNYQSVPDSTPFFIDCSTNLYQIQPQAMKIQHLFSIPIFHLSIQHLKLYDFQHRKLYMTNQHLLQIFVAWGSL